MLVPLHTVASSLVCPRCHRTLSSDGRTFRCENDECTQGSFPDIGGQPVLVEPERSVIDPETVASRPADRLSRLPPRLRRWWKPPNEVAAANIERLLTELGDEPLVLVVGGGTIGNGVEALYADANARVVAFDIYPSAFTQLVADAHQIPFGDGTCDAVVVQAVLEHVLQPDVVVAEIHRVLRPEGLVYAETPFMQQVHAGPFDFTRFTSSGHRFLFRRFDELASGVVAGPGTQLLWSLEHLTRSLTRSRAAGLATRALFFWLRYLDRAIPEPYALDGASACFFLGRRGVTELGPRDAVSYYRGAG